MQVEQIVGWGVDSLKVDGCQGMVQLGFNYSYPLVGEFIKAALQLRTRIFLQGEVDFDEIPHDVLDDRHVRRSSQRTYVYASARTCIRMYDMQC